MNPQAPGERANGRLKVLALDTATENCSAALWIQGTLLQREAEVERGHADLILTMVDELLAESGIGLRELDAIAFGRGPGSFTGVRLAASVTQGLAFGAGLPVVPVSDLRAVAQRLSHTIEMGVATEVGAAMERGLSMKRAPEIAAQVKVQMEARTHQILVCNDARMNEVYWGCFELCLDGRVAPVGYEKVSKPSDVQLPERWKGKTVHAGGRGFAAYPELGRSFAEMLASVDSDVLPRASEIALLAVPEVHAGRTVQPDQAVPVYLRDDVARPKAP